VVIDTADVHGLDFAVVERNGAIAQNLFELVLQRPATFDEFTASTGRLDAGKTAASEFGRLLTSQEFRAVLQPVAGFVQAMFPGVLEIEMLRASGTQQRVGIEQDATIQGIMGTQQFVAAHGNVGALANAKRWAIRELSWQRPSLEQLFARIALDLPGEPESVEPASGIAPAASASVQLEVSAQLASKPAAQVRPLSPFENAPAPAPTAPAASTPSSTPAKIVYNLNPFDMGASRDLSKPKPIDGPGAPPKEGT